MAIIKGYIISLYNGTGAVLQMEIDAPTRKDANHCANTLKKSIEAIIKVNNRLCGWDDREVNLRIDIEEYDEY